VVKKLSFVGLADLAGQIFVPNSPSSLHCVHIMLCNSCILRESSPNSTAVCLNEMAVKKYWQDVKKETCLEDLDIGESHEGEGTVE
jgi:hypothetical protein